MRSVLLLALLLLALPGAAAEAPALMSRAEREYNTAAGLYNRADYPAVIQQADRYLREYPGDARAPDAWHLKAESFYRLGLYADALAAYRRLAELYPQHALYDDALYGIAWSLQQQAQPAEAATYWEKLQGLAGSVYVEEAQFRRGDCAFAAGDYAAAERHYKKFLAGYARSARADEVRYWLAVTYQRQGKDDLFVRTLEHITSRDSAYGDEALYALGAWHAQQGRTVQAQEQYRAVLSRYPESEGAGRALLALASLAFAEGRNSDGRDWLEKLYRKANDPLAGEGGLYLGQYWERLGDTGAARQVYAELIDRCPPTDRARAQAVLALGDLLMAGGEYEEARAAYRTPVTLGDWPQEKPLLAIARTYLRAGDAAEAKLRLERLRTDYPGTDAARSAQVLLAQLAADRGDWQAAGDALLALDPPPLAADEQFLLARCYYEQGKFDFALPAYATLARDTGSSVAEAAAYWLAATRQAKGEYSEAEELYDAFRRRYPRSPLVGDADIALGELYLTLGKHPEARAAFRRLGDTAPAALRERAAFGLARLRYDAAPPREAVPALLQFLQAWPDSRYKPDALFFLASAYFRLENYDKAVEYCELVVNQHRGSVVADDAALLLGKARYYQKKNDQAIDALNRVIIMFPGSPLLPQARFYLAKANLQSGRLDAARAVCAPLLGQRHDFLPAAHYLHGIIRMAQGEYAEALDDLARAQAGGGTLRALALTKRGQCLHNLRRYAEAVEALHAALGSGATGEVAGRARLLLGKCQYKLTRYAEADAALLAATALLPADAVAEAWFWLADVRFRRDDFAGVLAATEQYLALPAEQTPQRPAALYMRGDAYFNLRRYSEAVLAYDALAAQYPADPLAPHARYAIGEASERLNDYDRAMQEWERVGELDNEQLAQQARFNMAQRFFETGDYGAARDRFARLQELYPQHPLRDRIIYYRGRLALQAQQPAEAALLLQAVLDSFPQSPLGGEAGYYLGEAALADRNYSLAERGFTAALAAADPLQAQSARVGLAMALYRQQQYPAARETLKPVLAAGDDELSTMPALKPQALYFTALSWADEGDHAEAAGVSDRLVHGYDGQWSELGLAVYVRALYALQRDADLLRQEAWLSARATGEAGVEVLALLAQAQARSGDPARSVALWQRAALQAGDPAARAAAMLNLAQQEYRNGAFAEAREHARLAAGVAGAAADGERCYLIVLTSFRLDDLAGLSEAAGEYARRYPAGKYRAEAGYLLGVALDRAGEHAAAARALDELLALDSSDELRARVLTALAQACFHAQQYPDALRHLDAAQRLPGDALRGQQALLRAAVLMAQEQYGAALPLLQEALTRGTDDPAAVWYRLGVAHFARRDYAEADRWLQQLDAGAVQRLDAGGSVEFMRGRAAVARQQWQPAADRLTRALQGDGAHQPYAAEARFTLGRALAKLGRHDEAIAQWERVADLNEDVLAIEAYLAIADDLFARQRFGEARLTYAKVLLTYSNREYHDDALLGMARCDLGLNDRVSAHKQVQELLRDYADGDRAAEARALQEQLP